MFASSQNSFIETLYMHKQNQPPEVFLKNSLKKLFLKISKYSQEKICDGVWKKSVKKKEAINLIPVRSKTLLFKTPTERIKLTSKITD